MAGSWLDFLTQQEYAADAYYGLPSGTLYNLGLTESGNGSNLGNRGNIFQFPGSGGTPGGNNFGYGLPPNLDGNSPYSAGAVLQAYLNGPAHGDIATALSMYHGGPGNPTPYGSGSPVANFLQKLGLGGSDPSGINNVTVNGVPQAPGTVTGGGILDSLQKGLGIGPYGLGSGYDIRKQIDPKTGQPYQTAINNSSVLGSLLGITTPGVERTLFALGAGIFLLIGLFALSTGSSPVAIITKKG